MKTWILDLDGSVAAQKSLAAASAAAVHRANEWGPKIRLVCRFGRFRKFEQALWAEANRRFGDDALCTFYGSGDFHHVTLALLRRLMRPFNLLVVDKHPDWMRGVPFLHCGTWLRHAASLPNVRQVFHVGGDLDFDNCFRWLAPWSLLHSQRIVVFPARRRYQAGGWSHIGHTPVRPEGLSAIDHRRMTELLQPFATALARWPLYISIDKDVLCRDEAIVNWDSGHLRLRELCAVLSSFTSAARGRLLGVDCLGDWSPVKTSGILRRTLHAVEHPALEVDPSEAAHTNGAANLAIWQCVNAAGTFARRAA
jgi:hypothetical protein